MEKVTMVCGFGCSGSPSIVTSEFVEFAEYTSAQERVALGKKARKKEAEKRRTTMQEMIQDA